MRVRKVILVFLVCALAFLLLFATTAVAQPSETKFGGTLNGEAWWEGWVEVSPGEWLPTTTISHAVGTIKHLGRATWDAAHPTPAGDDFSGTSTFTFENGTITATYECSSHFVMADQPRLQRGVGTFHITGGTGDFEGASGAGYMTFKLHYPGLRNLGPMGPHWRAQWTLDGYLTLP